MVASLAVLCALSGGPALAKGAAKRPAAKAAPAAAASGLSSDDRKRALLLVDLLIESGRYDEAERFVAEKSAGDSDRGAWLLRLARIYAARDLPARAEDYYRRILAIQGEEPEILMQLGVEALAAGDLDTARRSFEKVHEGGADPFASYYLSETAFAAGDAAGGRRWAKAALEEIPEGYGLRDRRARLRMQSRLGWSGAIDDGYRRLYDDFPSDAETLFEWIDALLRAGLAEQAREPLALLQERFPDADARRRKVEAELLRRAGPQSELVPLLEESARKYPGDPGFLFPLGEQYDLLGRWLEAEPLLERSLSFPGTRRIADEMLVDLHRRYDHHAGPYFRFLSEGQTSVLEEGLGYHGYPTPHLRLEGEAGSAAYRQSAVGYRQTIDGLKARSSYETARWTAGAGAELHSGARYDTPSPSVFAAVHPVQGWDAGAEAWRRRPWLALAETADVGAASDGASAFADGRPWSRVYLALHGTYNGYRTALGNAGIEDSMTPEADLTLLNAPLYLGVGYRFYAEDYRGPDAFFAELPVVRRSRTHYATASFGRRWLGGRIRADGYAFNGGDGTRGIRFGSGDLFGLGANFECALGQNLWLTAGYDFSEQTVSGLAGRSHAGRVSLQWHVYGREKETSPDRRRV